MKKLRITIDSKVYEVLVETLEEASAQASAPRPVASAPVASAPVAPMPAPAPAPAPVAAAGANSVPSPLSGKIVSVECKVGDSVNAGDPLLTLEAMKMNTIVFANAAGTVKEILVTPGQAVQEGEALVTLG